MNTITPAQWDALIAQHHGHLLQSWAWGRLKSNFGWTPVRIFHAAAAAQVLFKQLPLGFTIAYIPKGPLVNWSDTDQCRALFSQIHAEAKRRRAIFLKIEPDACGLVADQPALANFLAAAGFAPADTIQPQTSIIIDLTPPEAEILAQMKQKTRYNIRLGEKKGVTIRAGSPADLPTFHRLSQLTASRDGFAIHQLEYYQTAFELFAPHNCTLLLAEYQNEPLAGLMAFAHGSAAYYFYGASSNEHRNVMPTYPLQWAAMGWAKNRGCASYDLWGIPTAAEAALEAEFTERHDGLWGVYRFKRGFGGQIVRSVGAFDYVYNPLLYQLYRLRRQA